MSAFLVENKTINGIVTSIFDSRSDVQERMKSELNEAGITTRKELGRSMFDLNLYSLKQRYGNAEGFRPLNYDYKLVPDIGRFQLLKYVRCFLYQACEGDTPEISKLYQLLNVFSNSLAMNIVSHLPEWDQAEWA